MELPRILEVLKKHKDISVEKKKKMNDHSRDRIENVL